MGANQSVETNTNTNTTNPNDPPNPPTDLYQQFKSKINKEQEQFHQDDSDASESMYPTPTGHEYDLIDEMASELPQIIDDETRAQVEEYVTGCDNGHGPMVACFSTAEYLSLFERKHKAAMHLFENTCFRPETDHSPNNVETEDGTKAYPPSCYNLARLRMTGKGQTEFNRYEGYKLFERSCKAGHDPACFMQAKMLLSPKDSLAKGIPYDPFKAMDLLDSICQNNDSVACFTLATMLLRGDRIDPSAENAMPTEARGEVDVKLRRGEMDRRKKEDDTRKAIPRDPVKAERLLVQSCEQGSHPPSCFNLAVMYKHGDDGVPPNPDKCEYYQQKTEKLMKMFGGMGG